jgi:hypothetical protein
MRDQDKDEPAAAESATASAGKPSRRQVMTATAAAAGMGMAVVPAVAEAATPPVVTAGPQGSTTVEFRGRIVQTGTSGQLFTGYGYLMRATNAPLGALFHGTPHHESTALLTMYASGDLTARINDISVHSMDIVGTLTVYQRATPGASFSNPASFKVGTPVARYDLTLQDVLAVYAAGKGLPTLTGDMRQTFAHVMSGLVAGRTFGKAGTRLRMFASGLGVLTDPVKLNSQLEIAGNWSVE